MELYNTNDMPLSSDLEFRKIEEKILKNEELTFSEKLKAGRDHPIKEIDGYQLKPDHVYKAVKHETYELYKKLGYIVGSGEYEVEIVDGQTFINNKGVHWYLGGASPKYGSVILECPAYKNYFIPAYDNGTHLSYDPTIRHMTSSGEKNPVPFSLITNVIELNYENKKTR